MLCKKWYSHILLLTLISAVAASIDAVEVEQTEDVNLNRFLMKLSPEKPFVALVPTNHYGLYEIWHKMLNRVTTELPQSLLGKSFGVMEISPFREYTSTSPIDIENLKINNIAAEVDLEERIICAMLSLMKTLFALDIIILAGVLIMFFNCFGTWKAPTEYVLIKV